MIKKIEKLMKQGYDSFEIAEALSISANDVEKIMADLYDKNDDVPTLMYDDEEEHINDVLYENGFDIDLPSNTYYE